MKTIVIRKTALIAAFLLLPLLVAADQFQLIPYDAANRAFLLLQKTESYYAFCEPCGDTSPRKVAVSEVGYSSRAGAYVVRVNGSEIDLAYTFVKSGNRWANLAILLGLNAQNVSRVLDESAIPEDIDAKKASAQSDIPYLSGIEKEVVDEYNLARTNPGAYAKMLAGTRKYYRGSRVEIPGRITLITREGLAAVDEAIRFLENASPLAPLHPSQGMSRAAKDHVADTGPGGITGHSGRDGSSPFTRMNRYGKWQKTAGENISYGPNVARDIVMQLIVDDGVAGRGHRKNIFNPAFTKIGVGFGPHARYGNMCVQTLAGGYTDK